MTSNGDGRRKNEIATATSRPHASLEARDVEKGGGRLARKVKGRFILLTTADAYGALVVNENVGICDANARRTGNSYVR